MKPRRCFAVWCVLALFVAVSARAQSSEFRGVWVDAWGQGFLNASQVTKLISDCRAYNFNAIVVQMRRRGDAFYTPGIAGNDPKTTAIASNFDALQDIINKAHSGSPRIQVHCWVTTHVIWSSLTPPPQAGHVVNLHPEYLMRNSTGTNWNGEGYYLDPGHPDATMWNYVMATNIVRRYDVDGFHWDYVRYPTADSGYNPTAIARYNAEFGLTGQPSPTSPQFSDWRRRQVTDFLRWVNSDLLAIRPNLIISCAVFGSRSDAYAARYQDWAGWNAEGILDICMPMGYTDNNSVYFVPRVDDAYTHQGVRRVYNGQGAYLNTPANTVWQLDYIRNKPLLGSVLYSYRTPNSGAVDIPGTLAYIRDHHQPTWVDVPTIPWKTAPTKGIVRGTVTRQVGGTAVYNASLSINTTPVRAQKTEPHGKFAFFETTPGTYTITATGPDLGVTTTNVTVTAGTNLAVNLALPPESTPPIITSVSATILSESSLMINWMTDENANSAVDYGLTASYGSTLSNATLTVNHAVTLTDLIPNTTYHYRVRSRNITGLQTNSTDLTAMSSSDVIIEARLSDGSLNSNPPYWDNSNFGDSSVKSAAPGLTGTGSRFAVSGTPSFKVYPTLPVAGGTYDVYVTQDNASSISDDIIVAVGQSGCTGLPATTTVFQQPGGETWEYLGRMKLNAGVTVPTLTFTYSSGTLNTGGNGRMYSDATKYVLVPAPAITNQPQSQTVSLGGSATFTVGATGAAPLSYQWRFEGANLPGVTASSYTRTSVQPIHEGDYSVVITNVAGAVTSQIAVLVVNIPPSIGVPPQSQNLKRGQDATFFVAAGGTEPLAYQWRFGGAAIPGADESIYTIANAQTNDSGAYSVVVTNVAGAVTSADAMLTVTLPLPSHFQSITLLPDGSARLILTGEASLPCAIEGSSNLFDWVELMSLMNTNGTLDVLDESASNSSPRFYRARQ
ncbi:MAG TPA: family 10 glycosylhydrolase [Candidatus Paceibacterota bacterium]|nr:family 10 glycosylhydrolase [Verrucomicrobiota bacterium]HSA10963.1 family 10 glycosylhydrolase [Candidatus Paceibacterota bacterium]